MTYNVFSGTLNPTQSINLDFMNFISFIIKFIKFKPIIKFKKFERHNYGIDNRKKTC